MFNHSVNFSGVLWVRARKDDDSRSIKILEHESRQVQLGTYSPGQIRINFFCYFIFSLPKKKKYFGLIMEMLKR